MPVQHPDFMRLTGVKSVSCQEPLASVPVCTAASQSLLAHTLMSWVACLASYAAAYC